MFESGKVSNMCVCVCLNINLKTENIYSPLIEYTHYL